MFGRRYRSMAPTFCRRVQVAFAASMLIPIVGAAQDSQPATFNLRSPAILSSVGAVPRAMRLTLADAKQAAAQAASDPLKRLGELQVEAARQHRLAARSMYFPNVSTQFFAFRLSEEPGQILTFERPLTGGLLSVPIQAFFQNQNAVNVVVAQPITQLFSIRQLVKIASADENIARAKAGLPVTTVTREVEKNFFALLVAEYELAAAQSDASQVRTLTIADSGPRGTNADTSATLLANRVAELTASLNGLLGLAPDTRLELVPPAPLVENMTLRDALAQAQASPSVEVIEATQTAVKAHAAETATKLQYVPGIAVLGGYLHQHSLADTVLPEDFAYIGVLGTYTLFDSFKREHSIKEAAAQAKAADLGVELVKAKAAAAVKTAYLELERSRVAYVLARGMRSTRDGVTLVSNRPETSRRAQVEADVFRAEFAYRDAYATLTDLIAGK